MGRGLFSGIVWGIVVTGLVLVVLALVGPAPNGPGEAPAPRLTERPEAPAPADLATVPDAGEFDTPAPGAIAATDIELPPGSEFNRAPAEREVSLPEAEVEAPGAPAVRSPGQGVDIVEAPLPDTVPSAAPEPVTDGPDGLAPPSFAEAPPELADEDPVPQTPGTPGPAALRTGTAVRPTAPDASDTVAPSHSETTVDGQDGTPEATEMTRATADTPAPMAELPGPAVPAPPDPPAIEEAATTEEFPAPEEVAPAAPRLDEGPDPQILPGLPEDNQEVRDAEDPGRMSETASEPAARAGEALPQIRPAPDVDATDTDVVSPAAEEGPPVAAPGSEIDPSGVRVGRLPTVGTSDITEPDAGPDIPAPASEAADATPSPVAELGALARNAVAFRSESDRPLFSVILIDAGPEGLAREALMTFSFPVTFAIDPTEPDAVEAIEAYHTAGYEVVALASGLPAGAAPSDLEVALSAQSDVLARAVAVMDVEEGGFQDDRDLSAQMVDFARETGHGLVTYDRGLNTVARLADQAGVRDATVFRMLDAGRPNAPTVRRMLDRAVFKARQDGHVVLVGHSYPDTVTALYSWALEAEAEAVSIAPISAILRQR